MAQIGMKIAAQEAKSIISLFFVVFFSCTSFILRLFVHSLYCMKYCFQ